MAKKHSFGLFLALLVQIWCPKNFLWVLLLLDIIRCCKLWLYTISTKTNELNLRKWQKKQVLGRFLTLLVQIWAKIFFSLILPFLNVRNCCKLSWFANSGNKKPSFGPHFGLHWPKFNPPQKIFSWLLPLLDIIHCYKLTLYAISRKTNKPNLRK